MLLFALVSHVPAVHPGDLFEMKFALEVGARHCAEAWGVEPPAVEVFENDQNLPDGCSPIAIVDDSTDLSALAYHYWDDVRLLPAARAFWLASTGLRTGADSLCEAISHEINEALADAKCDGWKPLAGRPGVEVAVENCDPVQTSYSVTINGVDWPVSNFVTPAWFGMQTSANGFDHSGELTRAGEVGPEGYLILRDATHVWNENAAGDVFGSKKPGAEHPWSRTVKRREGRIHRVAA